MAQIRSVAELKRIARVGVSVATHYFNPPAGMGDPPLRKIVLADTVKIGFERCRWSSGQISYFHWPRATEIRLGDESFIWLREPNGEPYIEYRLLDA